jgi:ribose transport system permease protein
MARYRPSIRFASFRKEIGIFVLLLLLCIYVAHENHSFFGADNVQDLARLVGIYGIFGIGAGIVIITAGIDLSVGSVFALEGVLLALALNGHWNSNLAVAAMLAMCVGLGLIHGLMITRIPLQPFIVTLCGLMIYRGLARYISQDNTEGFGDGTGFMGLMNFTTGDWHGAPMPFVIMVVIGVIMWVVVHRTVYGRYLFAVGKNEEAARYSGINTRWILASAYMLAGLLTGIAGILLAFYTNSISPATHGSSYELYGIAAAVLGGCSLRGGEGSVIGVLIGTALLQVLQNLVNILGIPSSLNFAVVGTVILIGVTTDEIIKRRSARVKAK